MIVYQIRMKLFLLEDIAVNRIQEKVTTFLDKGFGSNEKLITFHEENKYKNYCYDQLYPLEADKVYKKGKIYTLTIRTIDIELAKYFKNICVNNYTKEMKGLTADIRILPKKMLETVYALTPLVIKTHEGYWRASMDLSKWEERVKVNLIKKWNRFNNEKIDENFDLYTSIEFKNKIPVSVTYKNIKLLGDKIQLTVADNEIAQNLMYMALGTGIGEMNSRGLGFLGYRWL